jgi:hypothetical protein
MTLAPCALIHQRHLQSGFYGSASLAIHDESTNFVFANRSEENSIHPLTIREIADSQSKGIWLEQLSNKEGYSIQLVEKIKILYKNCKLVTPKDFKDQAMAWYHHDLQHPGSIHLEETLSVMSWQGMQNTIRSYVEKCVQSWGNRYEIT